MRSLLAALALALLAAGIFFSLETRRVGPVADQTPELGEPASLTKAGGNGGAGARDVADAADPARPTSTALQAAAGQRPPPDGVDLQDGYPIMGKQRTFFRRAGAVAIRAREGDSLETLMAGPFAGYTEVRAWPGGVTVLRAPEAEVARQVAEQGRAQAWLAEVRAAGAAAMANPVLIDPPSGLMMIPFGEIIVRLKEGVEAARYFGEDFARARRLDGTTDQFVVALYEERLRLGGRGRGVCR